MKKSIPLVVAFMLLLTALLSSCKDPCKGVGCLNGGVCHQGSCLCPIGYNGDHCEEIDSITLVHPEIKCGMNWDLSCINQHWTINKPLQASMHILPNGYQNEDCLLMVNPHYQNAANPPIFGLKSVIQNIEQGSAYKISCMAKINGYPDSTNSPSFAFYAFSNQNWYGEHYYGSPSGQLHFSDWSIHSYNFIGGTEKALEFELYTIYDSVWIADLKIEKL